MRATILERGETTPSQAIESPIQDPEVSPLMIAAEFYLSLWRDAQNEHLSPNKRQTAQLTLRKYANKLGLVLAKTEVGTPELRDQVNLLRQAYSYATQLNRQVAIAKASRTAETNIYTSQVYRHSAVNR